MNRYGILSFLIFQFAVLAAQKNEKPIKDKFFQLSLAPALGSNGLQPGSFNNYFSINLTSGYSASNLFMELGLLSNLNVIKTRGIQVASITNITGGNSFGGLTKKEKDERIKNGYSTYLSGVQISGLTNIVTGDVFGGQMTGLINLSKGALIGTQVSGAMNIVYKYSFGVQLAGLLNVSAVSFSGVQIAGLSNYTQGEMAGVQIALVNKAGTIYGKNQVNDSQPTGLQIGVINKADRMNGYQVGLINIVGQSQGTQIGLINLYRGGTQSETKDGTAIGLINIGDVTYASVYGSELFALNYELSTGNRKNYRVKRDSRNVYVTNALLYSHLSFNQNEWGLGYGLKKLFFNRSEVPGMTESKFIGYGIDLQHINNEKQKITKHLNLLTRLKVMAGKRIAPKWFGVNGFAAITFNAFFTKDENSIRPNRLSSKANAKETTIEYWPGLSFGVLLH